jgi:transposase InsO family protein
MRYAFIQAEKALYPVAVLCRVMAVTRSGFYTWCRHPLSRRTRENQAVLAQIRQCHRESDGSYGSPRIHRDLRAQGFPRIGRHRVARLMRLHGIRGVCRRRAAWRSRAVSSGVMAENVLQRNFDATQPNQKWAGDITVVATPEGWLYVAVLLDLYSRRVVGWAMGARITTDLTHMALTMAVQQRQVAGPLLHHSDRGSQYTAGQYQQQLLLYGLQCSMSRPGNCWDNAVVESFFASLKTELIYRRRFQTRQEAQTAIFTYIEGFYNRRRRHSTLGYLSPVEFERHASLVENRVH